MWPPLRSPSPAPPQLVKPLVAVSPQKGAIVPCLGPLLQQPPHPCLQPSHRHQSPSGHPYWQRDHWELLGTIPAPLPCSARSQLLPAPAPKVHHVQPPACKGQPQPNTLRSSMEVPCPGPGGTSRRSSCTRSVHSVCRESETISTCLLKPPRRPPPPCTSLQGPRRYPCPHQQLGSAQDVPLSPCFEQTWCNLTAWLQQGQGGAGQQHPDHLQPPCCWQQPSQGGRGSLQGARPLAAALSSSLHCPRREGRSLAQSPAPLGFTQFDAGPGDGHQAAAMWTESAEGRTPSPQPARAALTSATVLKA